LKSNPCSGPALIYADALGNRGGTGVYLRRLLTGFSSSGADVLAAVGGRAIPPSQALDAKPMTGIKKVLWENMILPAGTYSPKPGIVHLPAFSGRGIRGVPCAVTVHDLAFCRNPAWFPPIRSVYYRLHFRRTASKAAVVMVDSDFTASEAESFLGIERERIRRVYLSTESFVADPAIFRESSGIRGRYAVFTGTVEPRKNIRALLTAWTEVRRVHPELTLVLAGRWGWGSRRLREDLRVTEGVVHTGSLPPDILKSCVNGASLMVYPSLYEGFGLPPLEAASAGVPSVVTPAEVLKEVYGHISLVAGGFDAPSLSKAILEGLETPADAGALVDFARGFSVEAMASSVLDVYGEFGI
jgi:glycosyltransferase involved in cell wall biosynthesis